MNRDPVWGIGRLNDIQILQLLHLHSQNFQLLRRQMSHSLTGRRSLGINKMLDLMPSRFLKIFYIKNIGVSIELGVLRVLNGRDLTMNANRWRRTINLRGRASNSLAGTRVSKNVRRLNSVLVC